MSILDYHALYEMPFLEELVEDLMGTFRVIAFAGKETDRRFIRRRQKSIKKRYEHGLSLVESDVAAFKVIPAYDTLQELLDGNPAPERIRQICEDCLEEYLTEPEPSEEYEEAFREFYR